MPVRSWLAGALGRGRAAAAPDVSQHGESALLRKLVAEYVCEPFLIDAGAHDGVTISNSLPFIQEGWQAILIEPSPAVFPKLLASHGQRANVTCLQLACLDRPGEADLYFGSDGPEGCMATLCMDDNAWFQANRTAESVKVQCETLTRILAEYGAPPRPGILMVDCEGMDYEALLSLDFKQFRPTLVVTEEYESNVEKHAAKYTLLIRNYYSLVQKVGCNTVWVDCGAVRR